MVGLAQVDISKLKVGQYVQVKTEDELYGSGWTRSVGAWFNLNEEDEAYITPKMSRALGETLKITSIVTRSNNTRGVTLEGYDDYIWTGQMLKTNQASEVVVKPDYDTTLGIRYIVEHSTIMGDVMTFKGVLVSANNYVFQSGEKLVFIEDDGAYRVIPFEQVTRMEKIV